MGGFNNPRQGNLAEVERRLAAVENRNTLNHAAIGHSGMEVYDGGSINISNGTFYLNGYGSVTGTLAVSGTLPVTGGLIVSGTERITGSWFLDGVGEVAGTMTVKGGLIVEGKQRVSGTLEITGELNVTGPTKLDGKTDIGGNTTVAGTLDIKGKSTLQNDLDVRNGGKVKAGNMTMDPSVGSGALTFVNGSQVFTNGDSIQMLRGNGVVQITGDRAAIQWGGNSFTADAGGRRISNLPVTDKQPNLYVDASGYLYKSNWEPPE